MVILGIRCYFGYFGVFRVILVILEFSRLFWSLWCFRGYIGHIRVFEVILVILGVRYYFDQYRVSGVIFGVFGTIFITLGVPCVFWGLFWPFLIF